MYQYKQRVSYSQIGPNGSLTIPALVNYFQDCSLFHSQDCVLSLEELLIRKRAWLLNSWHIIINRLPLMGDEVTISTWPYDFNKMFGHRNMTLTDSSDNTLCYADSLWFYYDHEAGRPIRPAPEEIDGYGLGEPLNMKTVPRRIVYPNQMQLVDTLLVTRSFLDTNNHVNNGEYVRVAWGYLPIDFPVNELRVEYRQAAVLDDTFAVSTAKVDHSFFITL